MSVASAVLFDTFGMAVSSARLVAGAPSVEQGRVGLMRRMPHLLMVVSRLVAGAPRTSTTEIADEAAPDTPRSLRRGKATLG
jgi:hypothetical protein